MKRLLTCALALLLPVAASATTLNPIQLLNPVGSTSGQAIVSTGASSAPSWQGVALLTGATFTGDLQLNYTAPTQRALKWFAGTNERWQIFTDGTTESGSNAGSNFAIGRFADAGTYIDNAFQINRSTGAVTAPDGITNSPISGSTGAFTTLSASSTVSGTGFSTYLASPPAIGSTAANTGKFTTLQATSAITPAYPAGIVGNVTGSNVSAGSVGEYLSATASAVSATSGTLGNVVSLPLTAGDWDLGCALQTNPAAGTTTSGLNYGLTTTSGGQAAFPNVILQSVSFPAAVGYDGTCPAMRLNVSGATTVYLTAATTFASSTLTHSGYIWARRH